MEKQITCNMDWVQVDTDRGIFYIPEEDVPQTIVRHCDNVADDMVGADDVCGTVRCDLMDYIPECYDANQIISVERVSGHGARLSSPGYLDCSGWAVFDTEEDAKTWLDVCLE